MSGSPGKGRLIVVPSPSFFPSSVKLPAGAAPKLVRKALPMIMSTMSAASSLAALFRDWHSRKQTCVWIAAVLVGADEEDVGVLIEDVMGSVAMVHIKVEYHDLQLNKKSEYAASCLALSHIGLLSSQ